MLYEYAIHPDYLIQISKNTRDYKFFFNEFNLGRPKKISKYPRLKHLKRLLKQGSELLSDMHQTRLIEVVKFIEETAVERLSGYEKIKCWEDNVASVHKICPFDVIMCDAPMGTLKLKDFLEGDDKKPFDSIFSTRDGSELADKFKNVLRLSTKVVFVDPFFSADNNFYWKALEKYIRNALENRPVAPLQIEILYSDGSDNRQINLPAPKYSLNKFEKDYPDLASKCQITFSHGTFVAKKFHNRFLITDIIGIQAGATFFENPDQGDDNYSILGEKSYEQRKSEYLDKNAFNVSNSCSNKTKPLER